MAGGVWTTVLCMFLAFGAGQLVGASHGNDLEPCDSTKYCKDENDKIPEYRPCKQSYQDLKHFSILGPNKGIVEKFPGDSVSLECEAEKKQEEVVHNYVMKLWWCDVTSHNCICPSTGPYYPTPPFNEEKYYLALNKTNKTYYLTSKITVSNLTAGVEHMFVCLVQIGGGPFTDATENVTVIFKDPLEPKIVQNTQKTYRAFEGNTSRLVCKASGFPTPTLNWTKDGDPVVYNSSSQSRIYKDERQWLVIEKVNKEDEGTYNCIAANSVGEDISQPIDLVVMKQHDDGGGYHWLLPVVIAAAVTAGVMLVLVVLFVVHRYRVAKKKKAASHAIDVKSPIHVDGNFVVNTGDNARININSVTMDSGEDLAEHMLAEQHGNQDVFYEGSSARLNGNAHDHTLARSPSNRCDIFLSFHPDDKDIAHEMRERLVKNRKHVNVTLQSDIQCHKNNNDEYITCIKQATKLVALISLSFLKSKKHVKLLERALDVMSEDGDMIHENRYIAVYFVPLEKVPEELTSVVFLDYNVESDSVYFWKKFPKTVVPAGEVFL